MHVHILGICGTFMGSLALLARELGHTVTGSDANIYPPMSTQLERAGITIQEGYAASHLQPAPDLVIVGNAMSRGVEAVEYMLNQGLAYTSGPQFLSEHVLQHRHVLAVAGTHGKTTTTTMLAWILQYCGIDTGFLIGGVPLVQSEDARLTKVFTHSSYLGSDSRVSVDNKALNADALNAGALNKDALDDKNLSQEPENKEALTTCGYFVIEADEYDSAFFDKRSKFVHYRPRTAILNNLEFDHADIFADLAAIQTQFHHMIRMIPSLGQIIMPANTPSLETTIDRGCWTPIWRTHISMEDTQSCHQYPWQAHLKSDDGSHFEVFFQESDSVQSSQALKLSQSSQSGTVEWGMSGQHNVENALAAIAAAHTVGISVNDACDALSKFAGIKRRMELIGDLSLKTPQGGSARRVQIYDDFAHHPTAIATTLDGAKKKLKNTKIWAIIEPRSNTMKLGVHKDSLASSAQLADIVIWYEPAGLEWGLSEVINATESPNSMQSVMSDTQAIIDRIVLQLNETEDDAVIVIMSNGGFENLHQRLLQRLQSEQS